ncbi:hypothetical protein HYC85_025811 [Camellia sinensis]|uniref:Uncharacterized protein n=1 Tax=Camellia sinensis TaxID=4442 RepID=A0A7J7GDC4_CAMSI|nr:hypothetical protein HYC85_025811 [Camellia sinensis]
MKWLLKQSKITAKSHLTPPRPSTTATSQQNQMKWSDITAKSNESQMHQVNARTDITTYTTPYQITVV